ncbi:PGPGW domain-containing protein [Puniceicoccus vermicola]|uniref:Transmembrane protein (PGPGW) n=1 Tax=Puniceicoccus vermicola TaxID=388746 RepID=A0A7X1B1G4_9BACT|nr:PGPGW domain-containing protein [Puniceicoccus vermicola]MBC2603880.1 hypothetical protein [Puniceicoccus vermicola]
MKAADFTIRIHDGNENLLPRKRLGPLPKLAGSQPTLHRIAVDISQILEENQTILTVLGISSVLFFIGSLLVIPLVVAYLPQDFFVREPPSVQWTNPLSVLRKILKNALGGIFLFAGFLMLFLPGQGLLSILLGISLVDFPAKRRWQLSLVRRKGIRKTVDWMRRKANRPPLEIPDPAHP